jgi:molybdate transport system regulatory protein
MTAETPRTDAPPRASPRSSPEQAKPTLRFRMRITIGDVIAIGPGKIALLEAVDRTGSITAAAKSLGMSYRRAWILLDEMNRALRQPAVGSAKGGADGGRSTLTDAGRQLLTLYRRIEETAATAGEDDIRQLMAMLAP